MNDLLLNDPVFKSGQKKGAEDTIIIPLLEKLKVPHAISIGPTAKNMAQAYESSLDELYQREKTFLEKNGLSSLEDALISIVPDPNKPKVISVTNDDNLHLESGTKIQAECLFTTTPGLLLVHKPADCPTAIIKARSGEGQDVLGIAHLGRPQVNQRTTEQVINYLLKYYKCNPSDIYMGIAPSIGPQYYWIKKADQDEKNIIDRDYWGSFAQDDVTDKETIIRVNVLGKILSILSEYKIPDENIQAYGHNDSVDTFALAANNPPQAFSHRFSTSTGQPQRNGRIMIAAQLPTIQG